MNINIEHFVLFINIIIIWFFLVINLGYIALLVCSISDIFNRFREANIGNMNLFVDSQFLPPVTAIVPAYNEENNILNTLRSLLQSNYSKTEIIVINDGSTDKTMSILHEFFELQPIFPVYAQKIKTEAAVNAYYQSTNYPNLKVIDKIHSGKSESMNIALNACTTPIFLTIDADTILEPDAISTLIFSMLSHDHTMAVGGSIYIANRCTIKDGQLSEIRIPVSLVAAIQACEYLRAFLFGRTGWNPFGGPLILSGALTLLELQAVLEIGGFNPEAPGEDMEVIVALHDRMRTNRFPYRISYSFGAVAWTHCPEEITCLWAQRSRWHQGLIYSLWRHKNMLFNAEYGIIGLVAFPFQFFAEFLGPIIELFGYVAVAFAMYFNIINWYIAILFFITTAGFNAILTLGTSLISMLTFNKYKRPQDIFFLLFLSLFENIGYRQILAGCRVIATILFPFKKSLHGANRSKQKDKAHVA